MTWTNTTASYTMGSSSGTGYIRMPPVVQEDKPVVAGDGPIECSSETGLLPYPFNWVHDPNRYYATLGVDPNTSPRPSRAELRAAFFKLQPRGPEDEWITHCFQQLFNREIRETYDSLPLGVVYLDHFERDKIQKRLLAEASRRMAEKGKDPLDQEALQAEQDVLLEEMGLAEDTPEDALDETASEAQDADSAKFEFSFFLWRTRDRGHPDRIKLLDWQSLIVRELARRAVKMKFSVGIFGRSPARALTGRIGPLVVFFVNASEDPTEELARYVVTQICGPESATPSVSPSPSTER